MRNLRTFAVGAGTVGGSAIAAAAIAVSALLQCARADRLRRSSLRPQRAGDRSHRAGRADRLAARGAFAGAVAKLTVTGTTTDDSGVASSRSTGSMPSSRPMARGPRRSGRAGTQLIPCGRADKQATSARNRARSWSARCSRSHRPCHTRSPRRCRADLRRDRPRHHRLSPACDVESLVASHNPVIDVGGGPDCNYVQASITRSASAARPREPDAAGRGLGSTSSSIRSRRHAPGVLGVLLRRHRDISVGASHVKVTGMLDVGVRAGEFDVALVDQQVVVTGFDVDLGGVPGDVVGWLHSTRARPHPRRSDRAPRRAVAQPRARRAQRHPHDRRARQQVDIQLAPAQIAFDARGALIELDSELRAHGDASSPGYVYIANQQPAMSTDRASRWRWPTTRPTSCSPACGPPRASITRSTSRPAATRDRQALRPGRAVGRRAAVCQCRRRRPAAHDRRSGRHVPQRNTVATQIAISAEVAVKVVTDATASRGSTRHADDLRRRARRQRHRRQRAVQCAVRGDRIVRAVA